MSSTSPPSFNAPSFPGAGAAHVHTLRPAPRGQGWACRAPQGCTRGVTNYFTGNGVQRWTCADCAAALDPFDLCDVDAMACGSVACVSVHPHPLALWRTPTDSGAGRGLWLCDGARLARGCPRSVTYETCSGVAHWRCEQCNFDLAPIPASMPRAPPSSPAAAAASASAASSPSCSPTAPPSAESEVTSVRVSVHRHPLVLHTRRTLWRCDGAREVSGCRGNVTPSTCSGVKRWRCELCDYDLCDLDVAAYNLAPPPTKPPALPLTPTKITSSALVGTSSSSASSPSRPTVTGGLRVGVSQVWVYLHLHPLVLCGVRGQEWRCDGERQPGGCRRGVNTTNYITTQRWRCDACDFDLCDLDAASFRVPAPWAGSGAEATASVRVYIHQHPLYSTRTEGEWICDARSEPGSCLRGIVGMGGKSCRGVSRWQCRECDFDLCDLDVGQYRCPPHYLPPPIMGGSVVSVWIHPHPLAQCFNELGWNCDAIHEVGSCRRKVGTHPKSHVGVKRWRCEKCDFDLCDLDVALFRSAPPPVGVVASANSSLPPVVNVYLHDHPLTMSGAKASWLCAAQQEVGGCRRKVTASNCKGVLCCQLPRAADEPPVVVPPRAPDTAAAHAGDPGYSHNSCCAAPATPAVYRDTLSRHSKSDASTNSNSGAPKTRSNCGKAFC
ncbi:hypothetical protein Pelo_1470 [Pelomyxa schiedti]|nr:hypothetical protein Pelo_1470 [Pelomyxa schiedti]